MIKEANRIIVTGLSGAGLSSVLKALEDFGYEVFDNFPLSYMPALMQESAASAKLAFGIDTRTRGFDAGAILDIAQEAKAVVVFITCDQEALLTRFTQTRRRHPLAKNKPVSVGVEKEIKLLQPILKKADLTIDTTRLSIHDLRHILEGHFQQPHHQTLNISLLSFGYKYGLPREADIVMDVRFLKNPHWINELKHLTGLDASVGDYIEQDPNFKTMIQTFQKLIDPLLPRYIEEGKHYLTIAFGCTGGQHRSVYTAHVMKSWLETLTHPVHVEHRDIKKS